MIILQHIYQLDINKFSNLIINWGYNILKLGDNAINFPCSYKIKRAVVFSKLYSSTSTSDTVGVFQKAPTSLSLFYAYSNYDGFNCYWFAIGY